MTGPRLDSFQRALQRFKTALPPKLVNEFAVCTLHDVQNICNNIQDAHGQEGKLRYMRRLAAFIEAMEQFGKVIELFTNVNEIVCFIWGPIRLLLLISKTHIDSFDRLLDMYDKIGNAIPGLLRYQAAFEKHPPLATVLEDYYSDILGFHQIALTVFRRPRWKELFHSTWKTFDSNFGPILQSMEKRRELLESEKGSATLYEIQKLRQDILDIYAKQRSRTVQEDAEKHRREVYHVREKLEAPNFKIDQEMSTEDRHGHGSGTWIFDDPSFCSWFNNDTPGHSVLYVNGIPGAGKTTLMSVVIEKLLDTKCSRESKCCVAYFYFKQKQLDKVSYNSLLRALLSQLVERDPAISDHTFEKISTIEGVNLRSTQVLEGLVKTALESYRVSFIVLDGLDECAPNEAAKSVEWFLSLINGGLAGANTALRVLFCGQRDGTLDKLLSDQPFISLEASGHVEDIRQYCRKFGKKIQEKFKISPQMEDEIIDKVANQAEGMFLYARVVLENLWNQTRLSRLKEEIEPGTFPRGIEKAYERVAVRIFEMSSVAECEDAKKVLGWIICARRLLRWREIQSLFCIDPVKGDVDYEERRLRVTCKELCGSLVDVHYATNKIGPEDVIKIVHETAREYLLRSKWLDASLENARLAIFCSRYLTSRPFKHEINEENTITNAVKGYYALQDYAVQYWFDHLRDCVALNSRLDIDIYSEVMSVAKVALMSYGLPSKMGKLPDTEDHEGVAKILTDLPRDGRERNTCFNIEHRTTLIRNVIESLNQQTLHRTAHDILTDLHGNTTPYKCTRPWCESFTVGFGNAKDRKQHIDRHDRPYRCPIDSCFAFQLGYDTRAKLDQHKKGHHPDPENDQVGFPQMAPKKKATIWTAAIQGDSATISSLVDSGVDANQWSRNGDVETPLYLAAKFGHFEACKMLLKRGANINFVELQNKRTALHEAVVTGNLDIVHLLISHEECRPDQGDLQMRSPFCEACALGHLDIVKLLLETGKIQPDLRPQSHPECCPDDFYPSTLTPLGYACGKGHLAIVQYLLQQGQSDLVDLDDRIVAARHGHDDIVNLLLPILAEMQNELYQWTSKFEFDRTPSTFIKTEYDWLVAFNPTIPLTLDVEVTHTLESPDAIRCVQFSPDGKCLAIGNAFWVEIHSVATGDRICSFNALNLAELDLVCFSPDGKYLAVGGDRLIRIWDITTKAVLNTLHNQHKTVMSIRFGHDSRTVVFVNEKGVVQVWDTDTQTTRLIVLGIVGPSTYAISPDMKFVAAGFRETSHDIWVWNIHTGNFVWSFRDEDKSGISSVAFSLNGHDLVSTSLDGTIKAWDLRVLEEPERDSRIKTFEGHQPSVLSVAFTSDARWMLSGSKDQETRLWDYHTGKAQFIIRERSGSIVSVATSPTGDSFATASSDNTIRIWSYSKLPGA